jgi:monofunctional biosynthetic peptidoglycan transglycosylase
MKIPKSEMVKAFFVSTFFRLDRFFRPVSFRRVLSRARRDLSRAAPGEIAKTAGLLLLKILLLLHGALILFVLFFGLLYSVVNPPTTSLMLYRRFFDHFKPNPRVYVPLKKIPKQAQRMFIKVEDYKFYSHHGVDPEAIRNAYEVNRDIGYNLYGGSTITMQLARTLFLIPKKSYIRKYIEVIIALELDLVMRKDRILELYINNIEWGKGVYGIGAASQYHFKKKVSALNMDDYRRLVAILTNPLKYNVETFWRSRGMVERYFYLLTRFPNT